MDLQNSFTVPSDIDTAWKTLLDVERVAPCMPGATLQSVEGDEMTGTVKVKLGPMIMLYGGQARFVSRDEGTHTAVIEATGQETRGTGTAKAHVTTTLAAEGPELTRVEVVTDMKITGKAAQFGRGVMQDVAGRIIGQFADNLAGVMAAPAVQAAPGGEAAVTGQARPEQPVAAESIDLLEAAGAPVLKRAIPALIALGIAVAVIVWLVRRRR